MIFMDVSIPVKVPTLLFVPSSVEVVGQARDQTGIEMGGGGGIDDDVVPAIGTAKRNGNERRNRNVGRYHGCKCMHCPIMIP